MPAAAKKHMAEKADTKDGNSKLVADSVKGSNNSIIKKKKVLGEF